MTQAQLDALNNMLLMSMYDPLAFVVMESAFEKIHHFERAHHNPEVHRDEIVNMIIDDIEPTYKGGRT